MGQELNVAFALFCLIDCILMFECLLVFYVIV